MWLACFNGLDEAGNVLPASYPDESLRPTGRHRLGPRLNQRERVVRPKLHAGN